MAASYSRLEQLYKSPAVHISSIIECLEGGATSSSIRDKIRGKGEVELPVSHTTPILFRVELAQIHCRKPMNYI